MLRAHLSSQPLTKFILIEDSLADPGKSIFDFLLKGHLNRVQRKVHYFVFHGNFHRVKSQNQSDKIIFHDFVNNICGWKENKNNAKFEDVAKKLGTRDVVIVDSLVHVIFAYGLAETYRIFNFLRYETGVEQIVTLLHTDLLENEDNICMMFKHLSTLSISMEPKFRSDNRRIQYTFKKSAGKIIKQIEEYRWEGENLITQKIERPDPKKLLENTVANVNLETLSTFRIGLSDKEKESREQVVLPYLPKDLSQTKEDGQIFYHLENVDDWDEEDPDDDLDI